MGKPKTDRRGAGGRRAGRPSGSTILADGGPATTPKPDYADFVRQRKDDIAHEIRAQRERSARIAEGIADARVRRAFLHAEAQREREIQDFWRRFFRKVRKARDGIARHREQKQRPGQPGRGSSPARGGAGPSRAPAGARQLASYSGPVLDRRGRRGVYLSATYLGARSASYGCARRLVRYVTDAAHVEHLEDGTALAGSNVGETRTEMSAAFSLVEDLNRAARTNAKVVFHLIVQLPFDVTPAQRADIMREWCDEAFGARNLPHVWAVHTPDADGDQRNTHGHVAVSFRPLVRTAPFTWDAGRELKAELDNPDAFRVLRERFAETMTEVCDRAGKNRTYTALSYAARGLKLKPTTHLGPHKTRLVRQGRYVAAHARNGRTIQRNEVLIGLDRLDRRRKVLDDRLHRVGGIAARTVTKPRRAPRRAGKADHGPLSVPTRASRTNGTPTERVVPVVATPRDMEPAPATIVRPVSQTAVAQALASGALDAVRHADRGVPVADTARVAMRTSPVRDTRSTSPIAATVLSQSASVTYHGTIAAMSSTPVDPAPLASRQAPVPATRLDTATMPRRIADAPAAVIDPAHARTVSPPAAPADPHPDAVRLSRRPDRVAEPPHTALAPIRQRAVGIAADASAARARINPPSIAPRPSSALSDAIVSDDRDIAWHRARIARAKAKLRAAEQQRTVEAAALSAPTPAPAPAPAAPARRRPVKARSALQDWIAGATPFDAVPSIDQPGTFARVASFDAGGALRPVVADSTLAPKQPPVTEPDGFGGTRTTPPPVFRPVEIDVRLAAFDRAGAPSRSLLALLHHAGHHPDTLAFAGDRRLTTLPGTPRAIEPLVSMWRHDDAVEALVVTIVAASRAAGRPVWPDHLAARLRALDPPGTSYASDRSRPRDWSDAITR